MNFNSVKNIRIQIWGLVQGVGFRPFVYRIAKNNNISGWVKNRHDGVLIEASGDEKAIALFLSGLKTGAPPAARIHDFQVADSENFYNNGFEIILSDEDRSGKEITQIGPDIAVCEDCLEDMRSQPHRIDYPFVNCTNCGPRFSIIRDLPYDREKTTMDVFEMCPVCRSEYENPADRRFHAQPVACKNCGPHYKLVSNEKVTDDFKEVLDTTSEFIDLGMIVGIKGIGGFFIACDATNSLAVERLRKLKNREGKPFAVMFRDMAAIGRYCVLNEEERQQLVSWQRPIVILKSKNHLPESVSNGISTVGGMLPYMPFHYRLFDRLKTPAMVFTSGNFADEPIVISNQKAEKDLTRICDAVVGYNREIYNRIDDSLLQVINRKPRLMRRSRGFAPSPVYLGFDADGILATGAELKNTFCLGKGKQAILSQHIGDLKDFETYSFFESNIRQFRKMFRVEPQLVAADLHPEYFSSVYAGETGLPVVKVQHHHAHIASAMAENGLDEKVIGIGFDGTGLGDDGNIWGSEFLVCDLAGYERKLHFEYIPLPGGDLAAKEPWRTAVSWLYKVFGDDFVDFDVPCIKSQMGENIDWVIKAIREQINCPLSSGAGRLFDAVAALLGLCTRSTFEAEAPMRLENMAVKNETGIYPFKLSQVIEFSEMFAEIMDNLSKKVGFGIIAAKFHNTVSEAIIEGVKKIGNETGIKKVVLSGGTFQNRYLLERTENRLYDLGFEVFGNCSVPCNDGGIALGQLAIAAKRRSLQSQSQ